ncbi:increased loss of mitochondrial DNA protein 1 [Plectosphaerella plurivora]|uniref:Increased loss of mitochondrial DNA protein 1 n=1 Tax=Plectosphaerella plurivora TaxID=936078 RepID=A0A9P8V561_9PEZI|nr:increased loss of mitochondrial DNA protein 1 [Plectosphaerella plurivora]
MALISASTIISSISLFHLTIAFFFLTNPGTIADQALVWVLGSSMGMPHGRTFETQSGPLAFLAFVLAFLGVTDLMSLSMPEEISLLYHWGTQAPLRLFLSLSAVGYCVIFGTSSRGANKGYSATRGNDGIINDVFFAFAFVEMVTWFWIWVTLREERTELVKKSLKDTRVQNE